MANWRDELREASFRGVPFEVESDDGGRGRRTESYEYPQRDEPSSDDFGRAVRDYNLEAFLIGSDFMQKRDALIAALEQEGPGTLVHPFYGSVQVIVKEKGRFRHSFQEGGMCRVQLTFHEAGKDTYPSATENTKSLLQQGLDSLSQTSLAAFAKNFTIDNLPQFVESDALAYIESTVSDVQSALSFIQSGSFTELPVWADLLGVPTDLGEGLMSLFDSASTIYSKVSSFFSDSEKTSHINSFAINTLNVRSSLPYNTEIGITPTRQQMIANENAVNTLLRQQAIITAVGAVSLMPTIVFDDVVSVRNKIGKAIDIELKTAPDNIVLPLVNLRNRVFKDLTVRSKDSARLTTYDPTFTTPSVVIAYELYEDAARGDEIVYRNKIAHPAFISESVRVLTR